MKKVLLVASPGGHFVQLSLLAECLTDVERLVVGTYESRPSFMPSERYLKVDDFSRDNAYIFFKVLAQGCRILYKEKPDLVVTTGAAPGLVILLLSKFFQINSIWIDSVANTKCLSLSGRIAQKLGAVVMSQWEEVSKQSEVRYEGRLI